MCEQASAEWLIRRRVLPPFIFPLHHTPLLLVPSVSSPSHPRVTYLQQSQLKLISLPFLPLNNTGCTHTYTLYMCVHTLQRLSGNVVARQHCFPHKHKERSVDRESWWWMDRICWLLYMCEARWQWYIVAGCQQQQWAAARIFVPHTVMHYPFLCSGMRQTHSLLSSTRQHTPLSIKYGCYSCS